VPTHPRLARLRSSHSYWAVLGAVVVGFLFTAVAPNERWATSLLALTWSATLLLALWTAGWGVAEARPAFGLAAVGIAAATANLIWSGKAIQAAVSILLGLLVIGIAVVIARGAIEQGEVNPRSVAGALSVYLLIGLVFVFVYGVVATVGSGPFFAQGTDGTRSIRLYFSFVTLATLGYGDYTPAANAGRTLAVIEALLGQLYLVTVVAVVVTRLGQRRPNA
jgi:ion channel